MDMVTRTHRTQPGHTQLRPGRTGQDTTLKGVSPCPGVRVPHEVGGNIEPTDHELATVRFARAKGRYTAAVEAVVRGDAGAGDEVDAALAELNAARRALRELEETGAP